jgi:hypothetical protein
MERKNLCMVLVTVMLLSTSFIAGCTDPFFNNRRYCPQCGCHYDGTVVQPETNQAQLTLTGPDIAYAAEFAKTEFRMSLPTTEYRLRVAGVIPATNTTPQKIMYDLQFAGPTDVSPRFKLPEKVWTNYSITLGTYSTNKYIQNRTFFNGSNEIKGKLWNDDGGDVLNVTLDTHMPGIAINQTGRGHNFLMVNTTEWSFEIAIDNGRICID